MRHFFWLFLILFTVTTQVTMQEYEPARVITAENIENLQSVQQIDFARFIPNLTNGFDTGFFVTNTDGTLFAFFSNDQQVLMVDVNGEGAGDYSLSSQEDDIPVSVIDAVFAEESILLVLTREGSFYSIRMYWAYANGVHSYTMETLATPLSIWMAGDDIWLELQSLEVQTPASLMKLGTVQDLLIGEIEPESFPYPLAETEATSVRVGRIVPPIAVTSNMEGLIQQWNLSTGETLATATVEQPAVFGQINASATHFLWRDPQNQTLNVLDFSSGENHLVTELESAYAQYLFLAPQADIAIAVNLDFVPHVFAWDVATGEQFDLGAYQPCSRIPDMVRLSADGTTLIIGCDTGLDIWRIGD